MNLKCVYEQQCGGCQWIGRSMADQKSDKLSKLYEQLGECFMDWLDTDSFEVRDRVDMTFVRGEGLGLYHLTDRKIVDIEKCVMMSPALQAWHQEFRQIPIPIVNKGSLRLRVGINDLRGVWFDFSNVDIKNLLDEKTYLEKIMKLAHVEMGQRRKVLVRKDGELKLADPEAKPWFSTLVDGKVTPLKCSIADFTQPSIKTNQVLVEAVVSELKDKGIKSIIEFGSGIGNFTLPLAAACERVYALELENAFAEALKENLGALNNKVEILRGDYQNPSEKRLLSFENVDAVLVDPPRSGLKDFLTSLENSKAKPKYFFYISCYPESFVEDKKRLEALGYQMQNLKVVDQFPQTSHLELIASFAI